MSADASTPTPGRWAGWLLLAAGLLAACLTVYWTVSGIRGFAAPEDGTAAQTAAPGPDSDAAIREAAAAVAAAQGTFDFRRPEEHLARLAALSTGPLAQELAAARPDELATRWRLVTAAEPREVEILLRDAGMAQVRVISLVTVQFMTPAGSPGSRMQLERALSIGLTRQDGRWLAHRLTLEGERAVPIPPGSSSPAQP